MLKNSLSPRLLKKVQMSRGFAGRRAGYPSVRMGPRRWAFFSSLLSLED